MYGGGPGGGGEAPAGGGALPPPGQQAAAGNAALFSRDCGVRVAAMQAELDATMDVVHELVATCRDMQAHQAEMAHLFVLHEQAVAAANAAAELPAPLHDGGAGPAPQPSATADDGDGHDKGGEGHSAPQLSARSCRTSS
jgi:hypothetical protein